VQHTAQRGQVRQQLHDPLLRPRRLASATEVGDVRAPGAQPGQEGRRYRRQVPLLAAADQQQAPGSPVDQFVHELPADRAQSTGHQVGGVAAHGQSGTGWRRGHQPGREDLPIPYRDQILDHVAGWRGHDGQRRVRVRAAGLARQVDDARERRAELQAEHRRQSLQQAAVAQHGVRRPDPPGGAGEQEGPAAGYAGAGQRAHRRHRGGARLRARGDRVVGAGGEGENERVRCGARRDEPLPVRRQRAAVPALGRGLRAARGQQQATAPPRGGGRGESGQQRRVVTGQHQRRTCFRRRTCTRRRIGSRRHVDARRRRQHRPGQLVGVRRLGGLRGFGGVPPALPGVGRQVDDR
jgi:hypothetical protein